MKAILIAIVAFLMFTTICSAAGFDDFFDDVADGVDDILDFDPEDLFSIKRLKVTCSNEDYSFRCKNKLQDLKVNNQKAFITVNRDLFHYIELDAYYDGKCSAAIEVIRNTKECSQEVCSDIKCS